MFTKRCKQINDVFEKNGTTLSQACATCIELMLHNGMQRLPSSPRAEDLRGNDKTTSHISDKSTIVKRLSRRLPRGQLSHSILHLRGTYECIIMIVPQRSLADTLPPPR